MAAKSSNSTKSPDSDQNPKNNEAKKAVLIKALDDITKRYGEGSIVRLGEAKHMEVESIPTGSLSLDIALGVGGIPRDELQKFLDPKLPVKRLCACI